MRVNTWGYEIISSKHCLVGKCMMNGRHNMVDSFRQVTSTELDTLAESDIANTHRLY